MLEKIRNTIKDSPLDDNFLANVLNKMISDTRFTSYRFRYSTNAEDLEGFNGSSFV
jgi:pyruvate,water dikinase